MKYKFLIFLLFLISYRLTSQTVVFNDKLLAQLTKNQAVRLASNQSFFNSYEKQRKLYDDANKKITQIVAIQDYIYKNLVNVNSGIKQGKKVILLYKYFGKIGQNANDVLELTAQRPEYAILLTKFYIGATNEVIEMQKQLKDDLLREDADYLMDPFDREVLINNLLRKARIINGYFVTIKLRLEQAKETPYIYQIPVIQTYVNLDKMIVNDIIYKYKNLF